MYDKVDTKVNHMGTSGFDLKTQYNTDEWGLEKKVGYADKKISDTIGLVKKTDFYNKVTDIGGKIFTINGLATARGLNVV